jgi:hypothetical protein
MRNFAPALFLATALLPTAASAQFPPPGAYACADAGGAALGTLFLVPDGDYTWTTPDGMSSEGQITSAGTSVRALSGVLFDAYHLTGAFETDAAGDTRFVFQSDAGEISCGPMPG